jgi:hypothetical protein
LLLDHRMLGDAHEMMQYVPPPAPSDQYVQPVIGTFGQDFVQSPRNDQPPDAATIFSPSPVSPGQYHLLNIPFTCSHFILLRSPQILTNSLH